MQSCDVLSETILWLRVSKCVCCCYEIMRNSIRCVMCDYINMDVTIMKDEVEVQLREELGGSGVGGAFKHCSTDERQCQ